MRPDPVMDLVLLSAIMMGAIMLFVILWLLVRKYSIAPRGEDALSDVAPSQRRASKTSMQRAGGTPSAATGYAVSPALRSEARPEAKTQRTTSLPSSDDNRPKINHGKAAAVIAAKQGDLATGTATSRDSGPVRREDGTDAQNKPKASSGWVVANAGDKDASKQPSKANSPAEDTHVAPTGAEKTSSVEEQPGADGVKRTCEGQATREETSVGTSVERTTAREQRHHKKFKKQHRDGGGSDGVGSESTAIPEAGCDADTTTTKRKRKSRHGKDSRHTTGADSVVSNGLTEEERSHGGSFVPKSHSSSRRLSTKSRSSRKSATSGDARSDALTSPPAGWTSGQAAVENVVAAAATAETAVAGDDYTFLSKLPEMDGRDVQPPTPPHPNTDVFSRDHSSLIAVAEPVGAALTPTGEGASVQMTPNVIRSATGACKSPTPMKPNLDIISRERSPNMPASPHKTPTHPLPPHDET